VFLTGQTGFIGSHLREGLLRAGHDVPAAHVDLRKAGSPEAWLPHLSGIDVVINAAGIFRETHAGDLVRINEAAPCALFRAAAESSVRLVIQFSALGADEKATSRFHLSKRAADDCLRALPVPSISVQPSLVFGPGGASARLMDMLSSLPLIPLPGRGEQLIQPIHIDDLVESVVRLVEAGKGASGRKMALVGPRAVSLRQYLETLRQSMGIGSARFLPLPMPVMRLMARVAGWVPSTPVDPEALDMLERGNTADLVDTAAALGRAPRDPILFVPPELAGSLSAQARLAWLLPLLRGAIAVMWIWAAVVSLWVHPVEDSHAMLSAAGVPSALLPFALYSAAALDLALGVLTLALRRRRQLWLAQVALVLFYTIVIAFRLPEQLSHPFGPIVKNLPILVALWILAELDSPKTKPRTWNT